MTSLGAMLAPPRQSRGGIRRQLLAGLLQGANNPAPITHPLQGVARIAQGALAGKLAMDLRNEEKAQQDNLSRAVKAGQVGIPDVVNPEDPSDVINEAIPPGLGAMAFVLNENPDNRYLAAQLQLKQQLDPAEKFELLTNNQGNIVGQRSKTTGEVIFFDPKIVNTAEGVLVLNPMGTPTRLGSTPNTASTSITVGGPAPLNKPPQGYVYKRNKQGEIVYQEDEAGFQVPTVVPMAGSEQERKRKNEERAKLAKAEEAAFRSSLVYQSISNAEKYINRAEPFAPAAGTGSNIMALYTGSNAALLRAEIKQIQSAIGIGRLQQLRAQSATGASGFGQLNLRELELLINDLGALDPDTVDPSILLKTFDNIKRRYRRVVADIRRNVAPEKIKELELESLLESVENAPNTIEQTTDDAGIITLPSGININLGEMSDRDFDNLSDEDMRSLVERLQQQNPRFGAALNRRLGNQ